MSSPPIDYLLLGRAVEYYKQRGYTYVEAPWAVSDTHVAATCPNVDRSFLREERHEYVGDTPVIKRVGTKTLVGSAEQSFLAMDLPEGRYVACTPCFRIEPQHNRLYQPYFMKVELFATGGDVDDLAGRMLLHARRFLHSITNAPIELVNTDIGADILVNRVEVGSYGFRQGGGYPPWAYGTGLALPRFSVAEATR